MQHYALVTLLVGLGLLSRAQNYQMKAFTDKDGLSHRYIADLKADRQGFLWIATASGLDRFDGNAFDKFQNDPEDRNTLADNNVQKIYIDREDRLWVGTNAGLSCFHANRRDFSNYTPDSSILPDQGISFEALCEDDRGNIWVGTKNDLLIFNPSTKTFSRTGWGRFAAAHTGQVKNQLRVVVIGLMPKSEHELWVLSTYGLFSVSTDTREFRYYPNPAIEDYYGSKLCFQDDAGNVWIGTFYQGILCFHSRAGTWSSYHTPPQWTSQDNAYAITPYHKDTLIYCSGSSVILFDAARGKPIGSIPYQHLDNDRFTHAMGNVLMLHNHTLWLGTSAGLVQIMRTDPQFRFQSLSAGEEIKRVFHSPSHDAFIFTKAVRGRNDYVGFVKKQGESLPILTTSGRPFHSSYQYYAESTNGDAYLNDDGHFYRYDYATNTASDIPLPPKIYPSNDYDVRNMVVDRNGDVWVRCLSQGILKFVPGKNTLAFEKDIALSGHKEINALYYDSLTNTLWIAEEFNGIYIYDIDRKTTRHFPLSPMPGGRSAAIISFTGDNRGNVWMVDLQSGIIGYDHATRQFSRITTYDGLPSNNCLWIVMDPRHLIWISTEAGLTVFDPATKTFTDYTSEKGYSFPNFAYLFLDKDGVLFLPGQNGYYCWNTNTFRPPAKKGRIYVRDAEASHGRAAPDSIYRLGYRENSLRLLFGLLSFDNPDLSRLEYSLDGKTWYTTDLHSYLSFANLAPGGYDLVARIKNEPYAAMHVRILIAPPFWKTWWFLTGLFLILAALIFLWMRYKLKNVKLEAALRLQLSESEMAALRSQMNPHFIFNTLNSINSFIIENKKDEASDYLLDFSRLIRIILDHSQQKTVPLSDELNALRIYLELESRRLEGSFNYSIEVSPDIDLLTPVPPLIVQPFVENAIWHGLRSKKTDGQVRILVQNNSEGLLLRVEDNGVGGTAAATIPLWKERKSYGIAATKKRLLLADPKSRVEIQDLCTTGSGKTGTRVTIFLHQNAKWYGHSEN